MSAARAAATTGLAGRAALALLLLAVGGAGDVHGQDPLYSEAAVKAAFLYHFGTYVEWAESDEAITIAVLGDDAVFEQLEQYLPGRLIDDRPVRPRLIESAGDAGDDEVLFVGRAHNRRLLATLSQVTRPGRLVVTDTATGLVPGAIVNFLIVDGRVRFEIALDRAVATDVRLSSRLLAAAYSVDGVPND